MLHDSTRIPLFKNAQSAILNVKNGIFIRKKAQVPHWEKKYDRRTVEFGIVIDRKLFYDMKV